MTESWEEKTERLEREYQARIDRLREELREMESQLEAKDKRVAELERFAKPGSYWFTRATELESQLAWTPVSAGLPTEPGETVLVRQRRTGGCIYGLLWNNGTALHAVTEEQPCGLYEYGSPSEAMRDWDAFRRLPEEGDS